MKKQEFIHIHGLFAEIADYCDENGMAIDLEEYHSLETLPTSIHESKTDHQDAVFVLADSIIESLATESIEQEEAKPANAD